MKIPNLFFAILLLNILSSCVIGTKMSFNKAQLNVPQVSATDTLTIVTLDLRPYVVSGEKSYEWVGLQRSGYGIPYGVHTHSGKTLANEFSESIFKSFQSKGVSTSMLVLTKDIKSRSQAEEFLKRNAISGKVVLLEIADWKSDTMANVNFNYDLTLSVLDSQLKTLGSKVSKETKKLAGSAWNPVSASEKVVTQEQLTILNSLLNAPEIVSALSSSLKAAPVVSTKKVQAPAVVSKVELKVEVAKENPKTVNASTDLGSAKERMDKLKKARDQGVLTEEEYQQKRKAVVDAL